MILCPNCQNHEVAGALFCSKCGAQLVQSENLSTQSIQRDEKGSAPLIKTPTVHTAPMSSSPGDSLITLYLVSSGKVLPLAGRNEFTLGRITEGQPILPDVDLTPYEAYAQGVSRLHAALKIVNQRVIIVDMGSSNGTRVNGQKIVPKVDYTLNHGDMITLGKLKIQVLLRQ